MNFLKRCFFFTTALFTLFSCGNVQEPAGQESDYIEITAQQFATDAMQLGTMEAKPFERLVKCSGTVLPAINGMAKINAPLSGVVKNIFCNNGQWVEKNQVLMEISGNALIDIQKDFAEASANYKRLKNSFERTEALYNENVTSEKEFISAESEYKTAMAQYLGLKMKIEAIGFSASHIESGGFYASYSLKAPISGYISKLLAPIGIYIEPDSELGEIIDPSQFQLKLAVFGNDIAPVEIGQSVRFKSAVSNQIHWAAITAVGVAVDNNSKSIECYASITDKKQKELVANQFVESEIITGTDTVNALPSEALIKTETGHVILVLEKQDKETYYFKQVDVTAGRQEKGYTEILNKKIKGTVLIKGTYNIQL